MGLYINPERERKEEWLRRHGTRVYTRKTYDEFPNDSFPVVLLDNERFTAAAVCYTEREYAQFATSSRAIAIYSVKKNDIKKVCPDSWKYFEYRGT